MASAIKTIRKFSRIFSLLFQELFQYSISDIKAFFTARDIFNRRPQEE
jgi:hypothetical protein